MSASSEVLTIREIAALLQLAEKTVYAMALEGEMPAFKLRGRWRVLRSDFDAWLAQQASGTGRSDEAAEAKSTRGGRLMSEDRSSRPRSRNAQPVSSLSERVSQAEMHRRLAEALGPLVRSHGDVEAKPFQMDLATPLPQRVRVYMYNATRPPGGRPLGEHKIQLIVPGQRRGHRASFDNGDGRIVLLIGYCAEEDVFVLWDAGLYTNFAWSRNVQVKAVTIMRATAGLLATQDRRLRPADGRSVVETLVATNPRNLANAIVMRMELTRARLTRE